MQKTSKIVSQFYLIFFLLLGVSFLLDFISFNENFLIGGLFTIGFLTVLTIMRSNFTNSFTKELVKLNNQYILRQKLILIYKLTLSKLVFFHFVLYFKIRFSLIIFKFRKIFKKLLSNLKKYNFILIFFNLYFSNILSLFFYIENFILAQIWCASIKFSYSTLV